MLYIEALEVDDATLQKIESKHGVSFDEVEEVCSSRHHPRRGRAGLYLIFGQTEAGRYLLVVLAPRGQGVWKLVTARDMTRQERRLLERTT